MNEAVAEGDKPLVAPSALNWDLDVPVATHPLMLVMYVKVFALVFALMSALLAFLMAVTGSAAQIMPMIGFVAMIAFGLFLLILLVTLIFFRNRMRMAFVLDANGVSAAVVDPRAKAASKVAIVAGAVAGNPGLAGAGLMSASTSRRSFAWRGIDRAVYYPKWRAIVLDNQWRNLLILFCRDDNYDAVAEFVRTMLVEQADNLQKNSPLPRLLLRSALAVAAATPLFWLPDNLEIGAFAPFFVLCFALATIWLVPLLAWGVVGGLLFIAAAALINGLALSVSLLGEGLANAVLNGDDWARIVLALLGGAYLLWLAIATLRGRVDPALAGDIKDRSPKD